VFKSAATLVANGRRAILATKQGSRLLATLRGSRGTPWALALVDQLIVGAANFVTILLLGRLAGADELGVFALVMTVYYLMLAIQESLVTIPYTIFGVRLKGVRHLQYSGAALCESAALAACVATILAVVALSLTVVRGDTSVARVVATLAIVAPIWLIREFGRRYLFAHMQNLRVVVMSAAATTTQFAVLSVLVMADRLSAITALFAMGLGSGVAGFGWLWLSRRLFHFDRARSKYFLLKNWVLGRWILASQGTSVLAVNMMPWLIVLWLGPTATGIFAACDSILRFANPIIISLTNVLTPRASISFSHGGKPALRRIVWKASALLSLFLSAFCVLLAVAGQFILSRSFGDSYSAYWATLVVLGLNQLVCRLALAPGRALVVLERADIMLYAEVAALGTSLIAATVLIPLYGVLGAALSLLAGSLPFTALTVGAYFVVMRDGEGQPRFSFGRTTQSAAPAGGISE
jgi:O-antigen/teichoic acid export membrane protein